MKGKIVLEEHLTTALNEGYGNDSRQSGPFGDFADRPALRASRCVFHCQSLGDYERRSKLLLWNRAAQKKGVYDSFGLNNLRRYGRFVANRCHTPRTFPLNRATRPTDCADASGLLWVRTRQIAAMQHCRVFHGETR
jgi:hypothetical protein